MKASKLKINRTNDKIKETNQKYRYRTNAPLTRLIASGIIVLTVVLLLRTLWAMGGTAKYSSYTVSGILLELMFVLLATTTYMSVSGSGHHERMFVRLFLWMLAIVTTGMLGDVLAWGFGLEEFAWAVPLQAVGSFLRDSMGFPLIVLYSTYLLSYVNEDPKELLRFVWLVGGLCADGLLLVLVNQITSRSQTQYWDLWEHPWVFFFFLTVPIVVTMGIIFYFRHVLSNRKAIAFLFYELLVLIAVVIDILISEITLAYTVAAFSLIRLYISVQLEYEKQQEETLLQQRISIMLSQIRPHFLYNVLTGIRALCRIAPNKAEDALVDFTRYLRANLSSLEEENLIPFTRELEHTRYYVRLEQMRYGDDLRVVYQTSAIQFFIPALTLEPIVENAVRHGVMQREQGGTITIRTEENPSGFFITVVDDGIGFDTSRLNQCEPIHVGIRNVQKRLATMCGGSLEICSQLGLGTTAVIFIPK